MRMIQGRARRFHPNHCRRFYPQAMEVTENACEKLRDFIQEAENRPRAEKIQVIKKARRRYF